MATTIPSNMSDSDLARYQWEREQWRQRRMLEEERQKQHADIANRLNRLASDSVGGILNFSALQQVMSTVSTPEINPEREKWSSRLLDVSTPVDDEYAHQLIHDLYKRMGLKLGEIEWLDSPMVARGKAPLWGIAWRYLAMRVRRDNRLSPPIGTQEGRLNRVVTMLERTREIATHPQEGEDPDTTIYTPAICLSAGADWATKQPKTDEWTFIYSTLKNLSLLCSGFIFSKEKAYVIRRPVRISINNAGRLHNAEKKKAIEWPDGFGIYALDGVMFDEGLYKKIVADKLSTKKALGIKDIDQRNIAIKHLGAEKMIKVLKAEVVDRGHKRHYAWSERLIKRLDNGRKATITVQNVLYKTDWFKRQFGNDLFRDSRLLATPRGMQLLGRDVSRWNQLSPSSLINTSDRYFLHYTDPSTGRQYISFCTDGVRERGEDADAVMAWKHHMTKEQYLEMVAEA